MAIKRTPTEADRVKRRHSELRFLTRSRRAARPTLKPKIIPPMAKLTTTSQNMASAMLLICEITPCIR